MPDTQASTTDLHGAALLDSAFDGLVADYTADLVPSAEDAPPRSDPRDATPEPTREQSATPHAADEQAAAPETAPESLTLTPAELQSRIDEATRRAREGQSHTAQQLAERDKELRRLQVAVQARDQALAKLGEDANQRYLTRPDVIEEQFRLRNWEGQVLDQDTQAQQQQGQQAEALGAAKEAAASTALDKALIAVLPDAAKLGYGDTEVQQMFLDIMQKDPLALDFWREYESAADPRIAAQAIQRCYAVIVKEGKVALQAKRAAELNEASPPKTRTPRPQVHGSGGAAGNDPYATLPLEQRGRRRIDDAFDAWRATQKQE